MSLPLSFLQEGCVSATGPTQGQGKATERVASVAERQAPHGF